MAAAAHSANVRPTATSSTSSTAPIQRQGQRREPGDEQVVADAHRRPP
jgi:hypothetical protein